MSVARLLRQFARAIISSLGGLPPRFAFGMPNRHAIGPVMLLWVAWAGFLLAGCGQGPSLANAPTTGISASTTSQRAASTTSVVTVANFATTPTTLALDEVEKYESLSDEEFKARATTVAYRSLVRDLAPM